MNISKILKFPWWKIINSAFVIFLLTIFLRTCQKTENLEVAIKNSNTVAVKNKNVVKIINQSVTEVKKEIANINETIEQFYEHVEFERFAKEDLGKRVMVYDSGRIRVVYFQLKKIPIYKSVRVTNERGTASPSVFSLKRNILLFRTNDKKENILPKETNFVSIYYMDDYKSSDAQLYTVEGMEYRGTKDNPTDAWFPELISDNESNLMGQASKND